MCQRCRDMDPAPKKDQPCARRFKLCQQNTLWGRCFCVRKNDSGEVIEANASPSEGISLLIHRNAQQIHPDV